MSGPSPLVDRFLTAVAGFRRRDERLTVLDLLCDDTKDS